MPPFSLTDAAFEGFRLTRERPRVVAAWALLYALMSLITAVVMVSTIGPQFDTLRAAAQSSGPTDPAEAVERFRKLAPFLMSILPFVVVFWSMLTCAVYRAVLRPADRGFGLIRLGGDEIRMAGLTILLWLLMLATVFASSLFITIGAMLAAGGSLVAAVFGNLIGVATLGVAIWVWIRLSLAGPVTFVSGEIHIFRSWELTRGYFWRLVAAYGLAVVLAIVVFLLALIIFTATAGVFVTAEGHPLTDIASMFAPNTTSLASYFTPAQILYQAFWSILQVVVYAVLLSPAAVIYAALSGHPVNTFPHS
ncbi:MAG TPA: hypothetical protein VHY34_01325 [Caulobacteraceae bacterium]|jgi:hypothetical protein|nr:hypothetical protein [Caulobacteraceae bacterium]